MTSPNKDVILFDNPHKSYFAGQTVAGRIQLILDKPKSIKGIILEVKGEGYVSWKVQQYTSVNRHAVPYTANYHGKEEYLKMKYFCLGGRDDETITLTADTHLYPFSFVLPSTLPSSFEGPYGHIRYTIKVILQKPWKWNREIKTAFTVVSQFNLNMFENLLLPTNVCVDTHFWFLCFKSAALTATLTVPKTAYVPGEGITVGIEVNNASNVNVNNIQLALQQIAAFQSQQPVQIINQATVNLEKMELGSVKSGNSEIRTVLLIVPPLPPSSRDSCPSIINLHYQLYLEIDVGSFHKNLKSTIPITIGSLPAIEAQTSSIPVVPFDSDSPISNDDGTIHVESGAVDSSVLEPEFSESVLFKTKSIQDDDDSVFTRYNNDYSYFAPSYPTYKFEYNLVPAGADETTNSIALKMAGDE